jgi:hypothetical protein
VDTPGSDFLVFFGGLAFIAGVVHNVSCVGDVTGRRIEGQTSTFVWEYLP